MLLELTLKIGNTSIASAKFGPIKHELLHEHVHLLAGVGERAFPNPGGDFPFLLSELLRARAGIGVALEFVEARSAHCPRVPLFAAIAAALAPSGP